MKLRSRWIFPAILLLVGTAAWIDKPGLIYNDSLGGEGKSIPGGDASDVLRTCESSQNNFPGELIPDLKKEGLERESNGVGVYEGVPEEVWSNQAGFGISSATSPEYWAHLLQSGWYIDWNVRTSGPENNLEHWQMVRVHEDCISPSLEMIEQAAANSTGQVWIIGNEPDVIWQDNVTAGRYAVAYHALYAQIKTYDPTASIAAGGLSQVTPLRLQYLDLVLQIYQNLYHTSLPVDWWTIHGYVLREEKDSWGVDIPPGINATRGELREVADHGRGDLFEAQIRSFRLWMADHGYQDTPLALTEFGILMPVSYGFTEDFIASYLGQTFAWLYQAKDEMIGYPIDGYHLVQRWAWFSLSDSVYASSNLGDLTTGKLTTVGERFRASISLMMP